MDIADLSLLISTRQSCSYPAIIYSLTCSYFSMYAATHQCWPTSISVHVAIAVPRALIASWRLCRGAEEKVTTEIAFQLQALSAGADVPSHTHPASPCSQGTPGAADRSTCTEKQKKSADTPLIGEMGQEKGTKVHWNKPCSLQGSGSQSGWFFSSDL